MNWRVLFGQGTKVPSVSAPARQGSPEPSCNDPYAEKRRRAVELLGERYVLHPAKALHRRSSQEPDVPEECGARGTDSAARRGLADGPCPISGENLGPRHSTRHSRTQATGEGVNKTTPDKPGHAILCPQRNPPRRLISIRLRLFNH